MKKTTLVVQDYVNCKFLDLDPITRKKFHAALKFDVPHARHTPQFKLKRWDGKVAFGGLSGTTYLNCLELVLPVIEKAGYEIEIDDKRPSQTYEFDEIDEDYVSDRVWPEGHERAGEPILLRDYQVDAANRFFEAQQSIQVLSTGAGKTLMTACLSLAVEKYGRSIVIVPSKDLVKQTEADYKNLGLDVGVYYGDRKEWNKTHTICTWQSLGALEKKEDAEVLMENFLDGVVCVMVDEVHNVKGNILKDLLCGSMGHIPLRWGFTGTIPKEEYAFMSLLVALGPVVGEIKAAELQDRGVLANCEVQVVQLQDNHVEFADYDSEQAFLTTDAERLKWVAEYCEVLLESGNTLILVGKRKTGFALEKLIPNSVFLYGVTKSAVRQAEYKSVATATNKVIIATFGIASTGINIPRIFNLVLFEAGKSFTRTIQSVGRGLRKAEDKSFVLITDITSSLKFSKRHLTKRKEYYTEAQYPFTVVKAEYRKKIF